jgi:hypothetical protein
MYDNSNNTTVSFGSDYHYPSLMLSGLQHQQQYFNDSYTALILEEAEKLYNHLTTELTNRVMAGAAVAIRASSLPVPGNNNKQKLSHKIANTYPTE